MTDTVGPTVRCGRRPSGLVRSGQGDPDGKEPIATTYTKRISAYPSLPTTVEQGYPTVEIGHWAGLLAPRGTPQPIIEMMNAELQAALKTPDVAEKLSRSGIEPAGGSVADFAAFIANERKRLGDIAAKAKMGEQN